MHKVAFGHFQLAVLALYFKHVGLDKDTGHLGGHIINRDVACRSALGGLDKVFGALMLRPHQSGTVA